MIQRVGKGVVLVLLAAVLLSNAGCSGDPGATSPADASADVSSTADTGPGAPDAGSDAQDGAASGDGGAPIADAQARVRGLGRSAGAAFSKSANYGMLWTLGEGAGNNATATSPKYRATMGVAGATGK